MISFASLLSKKLRDALVLLPYDISLSLKKEQQIIRISDRLGVIEIFLPFSVATLIDRLKKHKNYLQLLDRGTGIGCLSQINSAIE